MKRIRWWHWTLAFIGLPVVFALAAWAFLAGVDYRYSGGRQDAQRSDLAWLSPASVPSRGRILAVVSSAARTRNDEYRAGYELTELSRAWWVFEGAGFAVDVASPKGGEAPMVLDDDLVDADFAFLNNARSRAAIANTLRLDDVDPSDYVAIWIVGGKGAMLDLVDHAALAHLLASVYDAGGIIAAVCHGPAALLHVRTADGKPLLAGRRVTGFSNAEELFLMDDARTALGFLLQDALEAEGSFVETDMYLENVVQDGRVLTGQNPWSTWALAEATVRALGAVAAPRPRSSEERAVDLLAEFHRLGFHAALDAKARLAPVDNRLLLMHGVIAAMRGEISKAWQLTRLARA